jgi:hypothetical protein
MTRKEFDRQRRVTDQSLTQHSFLAGRLRRRQKTLTLAILLGSLLATALAFAGEDHRLDMGLADASLPTWAGVVSTVVFGLALVDLLARWASQAGRHEDAAQRLAVLKGQQRTATLNGDIVASGGLDLSAEYWDVMNSIEPVPEADFVALKARHLRKVAASMLLDSAPGAPAWRVRWKVRRTGKAALDQATIPELNVAEFLPDETGSHAAAVKQTAPPVSGQPRSRA